MNKERALITLNSELKEVVDVSLEQKHFRFKCKRCAALCCKLGGPPLTKKDAGYPVKDFQYVILSKTTTAIEEY